MPRTQTITVYSYAELDARAQATARDWYRRVEAEHFDPEYVIEDFGRIAVLLGVTIQQRNGQPSISWGLHVQGSGASFDGTYAYRAESVTALKDYAPTDVELHRIAEALTEIQARYDGKVTAEIHSTDVHSASADITVYVDDDVVYEGDEAYETTAEPLREALRDLMDWLYHTIDAEYDYRTGDEAVIESIEANDYGFTVEGKRSTVVEST